MQTIVQERVRQIALKPVRRIAIRVAGRLVLMIAQEVVQQLVRMIVHTIALAIVRDYVVQCVVTLVVLQLGNKEWILTLGALTATGKVVLPKISHSLLLKTAS